jgi:hypothetical protein
MESNGTALHIDDRVMAIFSDRGRSEAENIFRLYLPHHLFKGDGGKMVAFVNHNEAVFGDQIFGLALTMEALNERRIDNASPLRFSPANLADTLDRQIEERGQPFAPLIEKLSAVDQYQRVRSSFRDQIRVRTRL